MAKTTTPTTEPAVNGHATGAPIGAPPRFRATSEETITDRVVTAHLDSIAGDPSIGFGEIRDALLNKLSGEYALETSRRKANSSPSGPLTPPAALDEITVVRVLLARRTIAAVALSEGRVDDDMTMLAMYHEDGPSAGLHVTGDAALMRLASEVRPSLTANAIESLLKRLKAHAPVVQRTTAAHLVAVANGVFNHARQELLAFSPKFVFLAKSPIDYDPCAPSPTLVHPQDGTSWDVEDWMASLSDDEGVPELLWEVVSATLRPGVRWNKAVFLHSSRGNNGKGTLCAMLRELVGPSGCASIPIANFGKPFALSELVHARAIIVDENSVGAFAKDLGDFKSVVTGDAFTLDRKYKSPVSVSFSGLVVQCVNDFPKSRDKSASYTRRQLFVPFRKWFGGGAERGYIKTDYLRDPAVLRYVLRRALQMQHTGLSEPAACQELLAQFQRENNPVRDFWLETEDEFVWDLLPTAFLYDLFIAWFRKNHPSGIPVNRNEFATQLGEVLTGDGRWSYSDPQKKHRPGQKMNAPEHLIARYGLEDWKNSSYSGNDPDRACVPSPLRTNYVGVARIRTVAVPVVVGQDVDDDDDDGDGVGTDAEAMT